MSEFEARYIAFSGGVESTTMALLFGHVATPLFADTGYEHDEMYERLDRIELVLRNVHGEEFEVIRVSRDETLQENIRRKKFYPSPSRRFCTYHFKIRPMDDFLSSHEGTVELMIGLNCDEADKRTGNHGLVENVEYTYPLVDLGISRDDCKRLLREYDLEPDFPPYMQRGGCVGCFYKSKREYAAMALLDPESFEEVAALEEDIQDKRDEHYGIHSGIANMRQFGEAVRNQGRLFSPHEMYSQGENTPCGVFCHR